MFRTQHEKRRLREKEKASFRFSTVPRSIPNLDTDFKRSKKKKN